MNDNFNPFNPQLRSYGYGSGFPNSLVILAVQDGLTDPDKTNRILTVASRYIDLISFYLMGASAIQSTILMDPSTNKVERNPNRKDFQGWLFLNMTSQETDFVPYTESFSELTAKLFQLEQIKFHPVPQYHGYQPTAIAGRGPQSSRFISPHDMMPAPRSMSSVPEGTEFALVMSLRDKQGRDVQEERVYFSSAADMRDVMTIAIEKVRSDGRSTIEPTLEQNWKISELLHDTSLTMTRTSKDQLALSFVRQDEVILQVERLWFEHVPSNSSRYVEPAYVPTGIDDIRFNIMVLGNVMKEFLKNPQRNVINGNLL